MYTPFQLNIGCGDGTPVSVMQSSLCAYTLHITLHMYICSKSSFCFKISMIEFRIRLKFSCILVTPGTLIVALVDLRCQKGNLEYTTCE